MPRGVLCFALLAGAAAQTPLPGSVYLATGGAWRFAPVIDPTAVAWGTYEDYVGTSSGFGQLNIATNGAFSDDQQMYAAGFLEGYLTQQRVYQQSVNMDYWLNTQFKNGTIAPVFKTWLAAQEAFTFSQVAANNGTSPYWAAVGGLMAQYRGLQDGYAAVAPAGQALDDYAWQRLQAIGDFPDLIAALDPSQLPAWERMSDEALMRRVRSSGHCSALISLTGDMQGLFFGHTTWFKFEQMLRIYKHFSLSLSLPQAMGQDFSYSGYPGLLSSNDDFWTIWSTGLAVWETTNDIFNMSLYALVTPQSLLTWQRARITNLLATNGSSWAATFTEYNSGTYNNQWAILDTKLFTPGQPLAPDTLWIVEQLPGMMVSGDQTEILQFGHWPSFNVPFYRQIYDAAGYPEVIAARRPKASAPWGELAGLNYQLAPRAQIFRRDAGKVADISSFAALLRQNNFGSDPITGDNPWNAICARGDLYAADPTPDGCFDTKAGSVAWWPERKVIAVNGPTTGTTPPGGSLPPFSWSEFPSYPNTSHLGHPPVFDFLFDFMQPAALA